MDLLVSFFMFVFGLCIGSFLNVVIFRLEKNESMGGRSHCPRCGHQLAWFDLIPVASFLMLQGKCRFCHEKISVQYPLVELATGLAFVLIFLCNSQNIIALCALLFIASCLIIIFAYDARHYIIPDIVLFPAIAVTFFYQLFYHFNAQFFGYVGAALVAAGFFFALYSISRGRWIGFGDVKLAIVLGLLLGWPNIIVGLFLSFVAGAVWGIAAMIVGKKKLASQLPFAPFLILGTAIALLCGQVIIQWYRGFLV